MAKLSGKVALSTGAARGQGRSHAVRLAEDGADIVAIDLVAPIPTAYYPPAVPADLQLTAKLAEGEGVRVMAAEADVTSPTLEDAREVFRTMQLLPLDWLEPRDVSNAIAFLVSDEARAITGVALPVDGGQLSRG